MLNLQQKNGGQEREEPTGEAHGARLPDAEVAGLSQRLRGHPEGTLEPWGPGAEEAASSIACLRHALSVFLLMLVVSMV